MQHRIVIAGSRGYVPDFTGAGWPTAEICLVLLLAECGWCFLRQFADDRGLICTLGLGLGVSVRLGLKCAEPDCVG